MVPGDVRIVAPTVVSEDIHKVYSTSSKEEKANTVICLKLSTKSEYVLNQKGAL